MRKLLMSAAILVPFAIAPAFAASLQGSGAIDLSQTSASSNAGVASTQGTQAMVGAAGNGAVVVGAVSGNYSSDQTTALAKAAPSGSYTNTTAQQTNIGGTVAGGLATNQGRGAGASGTASGGQNSQATGSSSASAANLNGKLNLSLTGHGSRL